MRRSYDPNRPTAIFSRGNVRKECPVIMEDMSCLQAKGRCIKPFDHTTKETLKG